ncbi:MAG: hypothetical protein ABI863_18050 [Ginsengibacter sp.]
MRKTITRILVTNYTNEENDYTNFIDEPTLRQPGYASEELPVTKLA